ncbi:MAG: hypothetical protein QNJ70_07820 [Xenococcaceae cyanobacterium MO_207.B15]|nr:hypothetical protein [Xenococcaceae cyanobacterium MO_207.B15]
MSTTKKESHSVETLHGLVVSESKVIITVTSTGCTDEGDFKIEVVETLPLLVSFVRVQPDFCKMAPHSIDLSFSLKEIGAAEFKVANLFAPGPRKLGSEVTTLAIGEENPPLTTLAVGEENPSVTTLAVGEQGNPFGRF